MRTKTSKKEIIVEEPKKRSKKEIIVEEPTKEVVEEIIVEEPIGVEPITFEEPNDSTIIKEVIMVAIQIDRYIITPLRQDFNPASAIVENGIESNNARESVLAYMGNVTIPDNVWQRAIQLADKGGKAKLVRTNNRDPNGKFLVEIK